MDSSKSVTATFEYNIFKKVIGKWDQDNTQKSVNVEGKNLFLKVDYILFNADYTFEVGFNTGVASGTFELVSNNEIKFTGWGSVLPPGLDMLNSTTGKNFGSFNNISITNNSINAVLALPAVANIPISGSKNINYNPQTKSFSQAVSSTATSTNASSTTSSCSIALISGSQNQTVSQGVEINSINLRAIGDCNVLSLSSSSTLPPGVTFSSNQIAGDIFIGIIRGTPTNQASGTYNYNDIGVTYTYNFCVIVSATESSYCLR